MITDDEMRVDILRAVLYNPSTYKRGCRLQEMSNLKCGVNCPFSLGTDCFLFALLDPLIPEINHSYAPLNIIAEILSNKDFESSLFYGDDGQSSESEKERNIRADIKKKRHLKMKLFQKYKEIVKAPSKQSAIEKQTDRFSDLDHLSE